MKFDPQQGDVFVNRGVYRLIVERTDKSVFCKFFSPRWRHSEWATVERFQEWARGSVKNELPKEYAR